jgi:hypothetical protein
MAFEVPVSAEGETSVAVIIWVPGTVNIAENVPIPDVSAECPGS